MMEMIPQPELAARATLWDRSKTDLEFRATALRLAESDPVHFINYFCWTFDPRPRGRDVNKHYPFWLFRKQVEYIYWLEERLQSAEDGLVPKCRDMGVSWATLCWLLWHWLFDDEGFTALLGSRNQDAVDDLSSTDSLFGRLDYLLRRLPEWMLPRGFRWDKHRKELTLINPENGNVITGEGSTPNFGRGGRYSVIVPDEFCFWPDAKSVDTTTADSTSTRIFISTEDPTGFLETMCTETSYPQFEFRYHDHPLKTPAWLEVQRERRKHDPEGFEREVLGIRGGTKEGQYYPTIRSIPIGPQFDYNGYWPLSTGMDYGLDDNTAILWLANRPGTDRYRIVDAYSRNNKRIAFFIPMLTGVVRSLADMPYSDFDLDVINRHAEWPPAAHYGDPAGKARNQVTDTSVISELAEAGVHVQTNDKARDHQTRRTRTFDLIGRIEGISPYAAHARDMIASARREVVKHTSQRTTPAQKPVHDQTSHYRSAFEYFAVNDPKGTWRQRSESLRPEAGSEDRGI